MLQLLKPTRPRAYALQQEKPLQWEAGTPQLESSLSLLQLEKKLSRQQRPNTAKSKQAKQKGTE